MKIDLFSADIKLTDTDKPGDQSFRLLEFNDGLLSGFTGYDALGDGSMVSGRVRFDYENIMPDHSVLTLTNWRNIQAGDSPAILVPRGDDTINYLGRPQLMQAQFTDQLYKTVSADLHFKALSQNKAYQYYMAQQAGMGDLFPKTAIIPTHLGEAKDDISTMEKRGASDLILKPVSECGGTGLRLITSDKSAEAQIKKHFNLLRFSIWPGMKAPVCLLQERVGANPVEKNGDAYDGTMRVVFSIHGAGNARECFVHDAYWKLPAEAMGTGGVDDFVSFSPSNRERKARKKPKAQNSVMQDYNEIMKALGVEGAFGDVEQEASKDHIHSEPVAQDIKQWLFPTFAGAMSRYFSHVAATDYETSVIALVSEEHPALQGLGWMMATHYDYYPAANGHISMMYPANLRGAIADSGMVRSTENYMHYRLKAALEEMHGTSIHCEGIDANFVRPLEKAISQRRSAGILSSLYDTVLKMTP